MAVEIKETFSTPKVAMALVHAQSCECMKSELDLFAVPPTQVNVETGHWIEHKPLSAIDGDQITVTFTVSGSGDDYIDLHHTILLVKAQIVKTDGTAVGDDVDDLGPVNNWMHSMFSDVKLSLNDKLVTDTNNTYPYRAYLENLLNYGTQAKESQLTSVFWYKDTAGHMDARTANKGFKKRFDLTSESKTVDLTGRLHLDMSFQERYILNGVDVKIELIRHKAAFHLMAGSNDYKCKLRDVALMVRKVKISPSVGLAHAKALEKGTAKYPIKRVLIKTCIVSAGSMSMNRENLFLGKIPKRVFVGIVDSDAYNGDATKNPFNFKHHNVNFLALNLDGHSIPEVPFTPDFANARYVRCFESLFSGTGKLYQDEGNQIDRSEYSQGYALYGFDLTPDLSDGEHFHLVKKGNLRLEIKFSTALAASVNVVVYAEFDDLVEIDKNRNVLFDFST